MLLIAGIAMLVIGWFGVKTVTDKKPDGMNWFIAWLLMFASVGMMFVGVAFVLAGIF